MPVSDPALLEAVSRARAALSGLTDLRWVLDGHLHLTLRFFADLPVDRADAVSAAASAAAVGVPAFDLELRGLGRFPPHGPLRVVWAGLGEGRESLLALGGALVHELEARGFPPETRPLSPHLTLARCRDPRGSRAAARAVAAYAPSVGRLGVQRVSAIVLYRSELGSGPPVHTPIARSPLAP